MSLIQGVALRVLPIKVQQAVGAPVTAAPLPLYTTPIFVLRVALAPALILTADGFTALLERRMFVASNSLLKVCAKV